MWKKIIFTTTIILMPIISFANPINELEATPAIISEPGAQLLITEISFKNSTNDWIKIVYKSPNNKPINLKGISFGDDKIFKTIEKDFIIASNQEVLLYFKETKNDEMPYLYTSKNGLTGTTEQIVIYDQDNEIIDALCWTSSTPTESEISDMNELAEKEGWISSDISTCILSDELDANITVFRNNFSDTNSKEDWINKVNDTSESNDQNDAVEPVQNLIPPTELKELTEIPVTNTQVKQSKIIEEPAIIEIESPEQPEKEKTSTKTTASEKQQYSNGNLSEDIIISEILPNPEGTDSKKEWIEIFNKGENDINLGNWTIDDDEDGSKPYTISNTVTINSNSTILIKNSDSKLSLGNKEDKVRLFNFQNALVDEVSYEEAPSDQSYSLITIEKEPGKNQSTASEREETTSTQRVQSTSAQQGEESGFAGSSRSEPTKTSAQRECAASEDSGLVGPESGAQQAWEEKSTEWIWSEEKTPNEINQTYLEFSGDIIQEPIFEEEYSFQIKDNTETIKIIIFEEDIIAGPFAKTTFTKGSRVKILVQEIEDNKYKLKKFEIINQETVEKEIPGFLIPLIIIITIAIGASSFFILQKKMPWHESKQEV